jgi:hypothetical protein
MNWSAVAFVGFFVVVGVLGLVVVLFILYAMASELRAWAARAVKGLSSYSAGDAEPLPVSGYSGSGAPVGRRDTAQKSLLQMLEDIAIKVRLLERERNEAVAAARALEREVGDLAALITLADEKVDEILKIGANDEISQPPTVNVPKGSTFREWLGEFSADPQRQPKRLLPQVFIPD